MEDERRRRLAENEAIFRHVNEAIEAAAARYERGQTGGHLYEFVCECSDASCSDILRLSVDEYEHVRARGERFAVMAGHEDARVERVVEEHPRFRVVEKFGEAASIVRELDPRRLSEG